MNGQAVAANFSLGGAVETFEPLGIGHINDTFIATVSGGERYIVQRINRVIFEDVVALMENVSRVTAHLRDRGARCADLILTNERENFFTDPISGDCWRTFKFVEGTAPSKTLAQSGGEFDFAEQAGFAFGNFARLLSDLPDPPLNETLPDFHNTSKRFTDFKGAVNADPADRVRGAKVEIELALELAGLVNQINQGELVQRVVHNDAKIENVLFDQSSGRAVCVVDLDTVMPGTLLHDLGDLVRSVVATAGEEETDLARIDVSVEAFSKLAEGYLRGCGDILTQKELELLPVAGSVISYEQALRFLTDHLTGDSYYRINRPGQNLDRARNQLRLVQRLGDRRGEFSAICSRLG